MGHNVSEVTENICWAKGEGKFRLGCKNLNNQTRSGRSKTVDSEAVFQAIEANQVSSTLTRSVSHCPV